MKILQYSDYLYPSHGSAGTERIVERLCRGFLKLGHEVYLKAKPGSKLDFDGVKLVDYIPSDIDIIHVHGFCLEEEEKYKSWNKPYVGTIHGGGMEQDLQWLAAVKNHPNVICVSKFVADRLGCQVYVHSCASPEEFEFNINPQGGFLYLAGFGWGLQKGLDVFIDLSKKFSKIRFFIAGAGGHPDFVDNIKNICKNQTNLSFVGEVNGKQKSNLLGNVDGLIYPTHLPDACPASVVEALMCGTPVIGSINGSMPELIPSECGFICKSQADYMKAIINISTSKSRMDSISRQRCRKYALNNYSDIVACRKHLTYYENVVRMGRVL